MPTNSTLYGAGIFTTIALANGEPMLWEKHWRRLIQNAVKIGLDVSTIDERTTFADLLTAIEKAGVSDGRARITFSDQRPSQIWPGSALGNVHTDLDIIVAKARPVPQNFRLGVSKYTINSRSPLAGVKSCNYLENIQTLDEAKRRGFDEAIRVNENGHVTSAAMANLFWLNGGELFTPSLATGCLAGTTREYILENLDCREIEAQIDEPKTADAIFLTSAGLGVVEVAEFDSRQLVPSDHPITTILPWAT